MRVRNIMKYIVVAVLFLLSGEAMFGQNRKPIEQMKADSVYVNMCTREAELVSKESGLKVRLDGLRAQVVAGSADAGSVAELEFELFSIQSSLVDLRNEIERKEQEWRLNNPDVELATALNNEAAGMLDAGNDNNNPNLIYNPIFTKELSATDLAALHKTQRVEDEILNKIEQYAANNSTILELDSLYYTVKTIAEVDSLYAERMKLDSLNAVLAAEAESMWNNDVFNVKSYCYSYLLDKHNLAEQLEEVESMLGDMRREMGEIEEGVVMELASYPYMKRFMLKNEVLIARVINNGAAVDSLNKAMSHIADDDFVFSPSEAPARAKEVEYVAATIEKVAPYSSRNPVPNEEMDDENVYSLLVGRYTVAQQPSIFRNAKPMFYNRGEDKRYNYYVGYYPTRQTADSAALYLKSKGFRNPIVTAWSESDEETAGMQSNADNKTTANAASATHRYRVEIREAGNALSQQLKDIVTSSAPGKELSRIMDDGEYVFFIGTFDDKAEAESVASKLGALAAEVKITVTEI